MSTGRVRWKCPGCGNVYSVRSVTGLTLCPDCKHNRSLESQIPAEIAKSPESIQIATGEVASERPADQETSETPLKPFIDLAVETAPPPRPADYLHLTRYLRLLSIVAKTIFIVALVMTGIQLVFCYGVIVYVVTTPEELARWQTIPVAARILVPLIPLVVAFLIVLLGGTIYLSLMAFIEFIRVIIDIEANTHRNKD